MDADESTLTVDKFAENNRGSSASNQSTSTLQTPQIILEEVNKNDWW